VPRLPGAAHHGPEPLEVRDQHVELGLAFDKTAVTGIVYDDFDNDRDLDLVLLSVDDNGMLVWVNDRFWKYHILNAAATGLSAKDIHELVRCHQARGMAHSAEAMYRAALMRTETRGSHEREDYPERDDKNWLKWIIVEKGKDGEMKFSTEVIPFEKYRFKPEGLEARKE
jgi:hypothetical protein